MIFSDTSLFLASAGTFEILAKEVFQCITVDNAYIIYIA